MTFLRRFGIAARTRLGFGVLLLVMGGAQLVTLARLHSVTEELRGAARTELASARAGSREGGDPAASAPLQSALRQAEAEYATARALAVAMLALALLLAGVLSFVISRSITAPLAYLKKIAERIAEGDVDVIVTDDGRDEVTQLARLYELQVCTEHETAAAAQRLGLGDITVEVSLRGEGDAIGLILLSLRTSLERLVSQVGAMVAAAQSGRLSQRADPANVEGAFKDLVTGMNDMMRAVAAPIGAASDVLARVAARDLTARVTGEYAGEYARIKESVNAAAEHLTTALDEVREVSGEVAGSAETVDSGSQELAKGASEQAASLEEVASSLQELSSTTRQNASDAGEARALAETARTRVEQGRDHLAQLSAAMGRIKESSSGTAKIVKTIDAIAFQTNLLALNAAVEAARAGDTGKGFSVVAEEVRALAQRSAEAARSSAELIEEALRNADEGVATSQRVLAQLEEVTTSIQHLSGAMAGLAASSDQQRLGVGEIAQAVEQMNGVTQHLASSAHESATASEQLAAQASRLRDVVGRFALGSGETAAAATETPRPASTPRRARGRAAPVAGALA